MAAQHVAALAFFQHAREIIKAAAGEIMAYRGSGTAAIILRRNICRRLPVAYDIARAAPAYEMLYANGRSQAYEINGARHNGGSCRENKQI